MEILKTVIHHVLLLRFDEIPFPSLANRQQGERLVSAFDFGQASLELGEQDGKPKLVYQFGSLKDDVGATPIIRLTIEERRILLDVEGTTEDANRITSRIREYLADIAKKPSDTFLQPIVKAEESEIIAKLTFPAIKLVSPVVARLAEINQELMGHRGIATAKASLERVSFLIQYQPLTQDLDDHRISLNRKEFILSPRPGVPLAEQIYYSKAPIDTLSHIHILHQLETALSES